jgi:hypothetical protein
MDPCSYDFGFNRLEYRIDVILIWTEIKLYDSDSKLYDSDSASSPCVRAGGDNECGGAFF